MIRSKPMFICHFNYFGLNIFESIPCMYPPTPPISHYCPIKVPQTHHHLPVPSVRIVTSLLLAISYFAKRTCDVSVGSLTLHDLHIYTYYNVNYGEWHKFVSPTSSKTMYSFLLLFRTRDLSMVVIKVTLIKKR